MKEFLSKHIFTRSFGEHILSTLGIIFAIYFCRDFVVFFLTAFLCAYLFQTSSTWCRRMLQKVSQNAPKNIKVILLWIAKEKVLITIFYIIFALILAFAIRDIAPPLIGDLTNLLQSLSQKLSIDMGIGELKNALNQWQSLSYQVLKIFSPGTDTGTILEQFFRIGNIFFQVFFAYILSYIWLIEYEKIHTYFAQLKKGPFAFLYSDLKVVFEKVTHSFGLVFQAQSQIALVNTVLTLCALIIIGIIYGQFSPEAPYLFPYLLALGCITFLTSFIPILGIFIGGIAILFAGISAYSGWSIVITLLIMLLVVHMIEGYFLNPRLVGKSLNIPAPIVFIILFISEHLMGVAGFFLGVPLYLLLTELIDTIARKITPVKK